MRFSCLHYCLLWCVIDDGRSRSHIYHSNGGWVQDDVTLQEGAGNQAQSDSIFFNTMYNNLHYRSKIQLDRLWSQSLIMHLSFQAILSTMSRSQLSPLHLHILASFLGLVGGEEREPGIHCLHMSMAPSYNRATFVLWWCCHYDFIVVCNGYSHVSSACQTPLILFTSKWTADWEHIQSLGYIMVADYMIHQ